MDKKKQNFLEPFIILGIVVLNAVLGVVQESKAEKALEALQSMSSPHAKVIRNGKQEVISSAEVVPVTLFCLKQGILCLAMQDCWKRRA